ncbi:hypothetical protein IMG5_151740, partial [Ichthyophthirius multifiliis]
SFFHIIFQHSFQQRFQIIYISILRIQIYHRRYLIPKNLFIKLQKLINLIFLITPMHKIWILMKYNLKETNPICKNITFFFVNNNTLIHSQKIEDFRCKIARFFIQKKPKTLIKIFKPYFFRITEIRQFKLRIFIKNKYIIRFYIIMCYIFFLMQVKQGNSNLFYQFFNFNYVTLQQIFSFFPFYLINF